MASMFKYVNYARDTICKNCTSFIENYQPFRDWCSYYDHQIDKDDDCSCSEYREIDDDEDNIPLELLEKGMKLWELELSKYR